MIIVVGEILIDQFPDYERVGGAPFNFAFHLKQMGWPVRFITRIGDDPQGRRIHRMLSENGFALTDVQIDRHNPTGRVDVRLDKAGVPQFDICKEVAYDYIQPPSITAGDKAAVKLYYFGSLVQRTTNGQQLIQQLMANKPREAKCFCDINLRPPHVNDKAVATCLEHADILKLSSDELLDVSMRFDGPSNGQEAIDWLMQTYDIGTMAITMGADGSRVVTGQGQYTSPQLAATAVVDTVGAGDAYAAVLAAGILCDLPMDQTIASAAQFAADMCALPGAIPDDTSPYASIRKLMERISDGQ